MKVSVVCGDITTQRVDAIVTAANSGLHGGSGVNGSVHAAAGLRLLQASRAQAPCPPGSAVITPAYDLSPVRWVIHAVGPRYTGRPDDAAVLMATYHSALARADEVGARSVAFPSISTGRYGYPAAEAARLSVRALRSAVTDVQKSLLVAYNGDTATLWSSSLELTRH